MKAVSLIEMMVSVAIIAIICVVVVVSFNSVNSKKLEAEGRKTISYLIWARERALATDSNHCVTFDYDVGLSNYFYEIYQGGCSGTLYEKKHIASGIVISSPATPFSITFNTFSDAPGLILGGTAGSNTDIVFNYNGDSSTVRIVGETGYIGK